MIVLQFKGGRWEVLHTWPEPIDSGKAEAEAAIEAELAEIAEGRIEPGA